VHVPGFPNESHWNESYYVNETTALAIRNKRGAAGVIVIEAMGASRRSSDKSDKESDGSEYIQQPKCTLCLCQ
ncbi:hypothetical protein PMAYCL1PPCAC_26337, partial [Pristionchus mayeri]